MTLRFIVGVLSVGVAIFCSSIARSQNYPSKPIRIVTGGVGGSNDSVARLIAQGIAGALGQPMIVDNRPTGVIPGQIVSKAPPDGYTLIVVASMFWIGPLMQKTPYDPIKDFSPITLTNRQPNILVVHPSLPVHTVQELIAYGKAKTGPLNYASTGVGSSSHLAAELFKTMAGVDLVHIPYKSGATLMADLMGGQIQLQFAQTATVGPHVKSGKLRALAVTSPQPSALAPGLPTVAASGLPGYATGTMTALLAPPKTPMTIINQLNREILLFLKTNEAKERFFIAGAEVVGSSPEELAAIMKSEMARLGKVIKDAGIKAD